MPQTLDFSHFGAGYLPSGYVLDRYNEIVGLRCSEYSAVSQMTGDHTRTEYFSGKSAADRLYNADLVARNTDWVSYEYDLPAGGSLLTFFTQTYIVLPTNDPDIFVKVSLLQLVGGKNGWWHVNEIDGGRFFSKIDNLHRCRIAVKMGVKNAHSYPR